MIKILQSKNNIKIDDFCVERSRVMTPVIEAISLLEETKLDTEDEVILIAEQKAGCQGGNYCSDIC